MALKIKANYGEGGAGLGSTKTALHPPIGEVLRGLIDDIASGSGSAATIASADAPVADGVYVQADIQAMVDLLNEIKASLNAVSASGSANVIKA